MADVDIATLGVKVDASTAGTAATDLDKLTTSAVKTETATKGVASGSAVMRAAILSAISAIHANTAATTALTDRTNAYRGATTGAAAATDDMEMRVNRLRASVDPLDAAIARVNAELMEARILFEAGAMSAHDYARAQVVLNARSNDFARRQGMMNDAMGMGARSAKLQAHEMLNLSRQFADIGVTAAMGMNPLMILVQQGPQIADVLSTARARGITTADAFRQVGASIMPWVTRLAGPLAAIGLAMGAIGLAARGAAADVANVQKEFGLTEKQMDRLKDKGVDLGYTMGDVMAGIGAAVGEAFHFDAIQEEVSDFLDWLGKDIFDGTRDMVGKFVGAIAVIEEAFKNLPASVGAALVAVLNVVIRNLNEMLVRGARVVQNFMDIVPKAFGGGIKVADPYQFKEVANPLQGQLNKLGGAYNEGYGRGTAAFDRGMRSSRRDRIMEGAGDPDKGRERKAKESQEEKDWKKAVEGAEAYTKALKEQTEEIGKNIFEVKQLHTSRQAAELQAAAAALGTAEAMATAARLTGEMQKATEDWIKATNAQKIFEMERALKDEAEAMRFEQSLLSMNNEERLKAIKIREISVKVLEAERQGYTGVAEALRNEARALMESAGAQGARLDKVEEAKRATEAIYQMNDGIREATESFGELFGTAGEGFANLLEVMLDYNEQQAEAQERLIEIQSKYAEGQAMSQADAAESGRIQAELAQAQVAHYGNMLSAAKTFFKEGSTGWKILEGAERIYRLFQFAMAIRAMLMDKATTTSSVANSGARAAADGVAAVAKAIASLPFPLNLIAGAATLAFLVGIGVKMFGGGKGGGGSKSASESMDKATAGKDIYSGPRDEYGAPTSGYSVLRPGQTTVAGNDNTMYGTMNANGVVVYQGDTNVTIQGNMVSDTMTELVPVLDAYRTATIQETRQVVAQDIAARSQRQRIGGG